MAQWWSALLTPQAECSAPPEREARSRTRAISRAVAGSHRPRRALGCGRAVVVISGLLSAHGNPYVTTLHEIATLFFPRFYSLCHYRALGPASEFVIGRSWTCA